MKLVGNGSEKAKRQHNPSSGKAKKSTFATCPHGALKQTGTGPQTAVGEHIGGQKTRGNLHSDKNEARWQRIRKGQTPSQPDRRQTAIGAFATRPHGTGPKRHLWHRIHCCGAVKTMLCSSLTPPPQARQRGRRIYTGKCRGMSVQDIRWYCRTLAMAQSVTSHFGRLCAH